MDLVHENYQISALDSLDSRLDNLWSDVEDAEIELEFDKQVTQMYFTKKISIQDYTKLKTSISKEKGKEMIRQRTHGKKPERKSKHRALKNTVEEYLQEYFEKKDNNNNNNNDNDNEGDDEGDGEGHVVDQETNKNDGIERIVKKRTLTAQHVAKMKQKREDEKAAAQVTSKESGWSFMGWFCASERADTDEGST